MRKARLKDLGTFLSGLTYSPDNICEEGEGTLVLRSSNIQDGKLSFADNVFVDCHLPASMHVKPGDILICSRNGSANLVGKTALIDSDINATWGAFMMLFRTVNNSEYMNYLLTTSISKYKGLFSTSTINQLTNHMLGNIFVNYVPDIERQSEIAIAINSKVSEIDSKLSKLECLRKKLVSLKQDLIYSGITHGFESNIELVDSGIDWVGKIPQHWQVKRLKDLGYFRSGLTYSPDNLAENGNGVLVLRSSNIHDGKLVLDDNVYVDMNISSSMYVRPGDILICSRNGSANLVGKSALIEEKLNATWGAFMMLFRSHNHPQYIHYLLMASISKNKGLFATSTINQLTNHMLGNIYVCYTPDLKEQIEIANTINKKCVKLESAIHNIIEQIRQYRMLKDAYIKKLIMDSSICD